MADKQPRGSDAITPIVRRIVAAHPDAPARTLARRVVQETNGAITLEQARTRVRKALGLIGERDELMVWVKNTRLCINSINYHRIGGDFTHQAAPESIKQQERPQPLTLVTAIDSQPTK